LLHTHSYIYVLLLSERQTDAAWEFSKMQWLFRNMEALGVHSLFWFVKV
jgi:hypothetical protein